MGIYLNNKVAKLTLYKTSEAEFQTLKQTEQNFDMLIADTNDISIRVLAHELVQTFIKGEYEAQKFDQLYREISSWLDDVVGSRLYYDSITISTGNKIIFQKGQTTEEMDQADVMRAIELQGRGFWTSTDTGVSYYRAIMDFNKLGRDIGIETFHINEQVLYNFYKNINSIPGSQVYLVDATGRVLSSTERTRIGDDQDVYDYFKEAQRMKNGFFPTKLDGNKSVVLFYTLEETNWMIIQTIPESSINVLQTTVNNILMIVIVLCLIFGVLFSLVLRIYFIKPLGKIREQMAKMKSGNFNIVLDTNSQDEIGEISQGFVRIGLRIKEMINDVYITKIKQREAELTALESQINPHFLYNTLDSIRWLAIKEKSYDVSDQIEALAEIFRHVLNKGEPFVTIGQEIDFLMNYMFVQKRKYGQRITLIINADPQLQKHKVPKLILQPLIENSIIHGLEQVVQGGTIEVNIEKLDEDIRFVVKDNGAGFDERKIREMMRSPEHLNHVFALKNIDERIKLNYGDRYGLSFTSTINVGTRVEVRIPFIQNDLT